MGGSMANSKQTQIGARDGAQASPLHFQIIEARYSIVDISADRVKANNQNYRDGLCVFDPVESKTTFEGLAPEVLEFNALAADWVGFPTIFIRPTAENIKFVPGVHTVITQAALAQIGVAVGSWPRIISATGGSPGITE